MASFDKPLITVKDIAKYRPIAELEQRRIDPYIIEAQRIELKNLLGDALHYDFFLRIEDSLDAKYPAYSKLLNGTVWVYNGNSVEFQGLIPMLAYYSLARFFPNNPVNITKFGNTVKKVNESEPLDAQSSKNILLELRAVGAAHQAECVTYLSNNTSLYPLYNQNSNTKLSTGGLNFIDL